MNTSDPIKEIPQSIEIEKKLLSCLLQKPDSCVDFAVSKKLLSSHFYLKSHSLLFSIIYELQNAPKERSKLTELDLLKEELKSRKSLEDIGGLGVLAEIWNLASTTDPLENYIEIVKEKFILRSIQGICNTIGKKVYEESQDVSNILDALETQTLQIREGILKEDYRSVAGVVNPYLERGKTFDLKKDAISEFLLENKGISSGFPDLDKITNGFRPGEVFILAARPAMGKTALMLNIIMNICLKEDRAAMIFSLEMSTEQLVRRLVCSQAQFNASNLDDGFVPSDKIVERISVAMAEMGTRKIWIDETPSISINEMRAKARRMKREQNVEIIAVDYLQLMRSESKQASFSREREIAEISAGLKALSKELEIPILILSQLNRNPEARDGHPRLSDLRESGGIEQDADLVGLLYRDEYYAKDEIEQQEKKGLATLIIAKNRYGATGNVGLTFRNEETRFYSRSLENEREEKK